jgi:hypothetical protein
LQNFLQSLSKVPSLPSHDGRESSEIASTPGNLDEETIIRQQHIDVTTSELREASARLDRAKSEEAECFRQSALEEERRSEAMEWMMAMRGVLWPENVADRELGRPVLPSDTIGEDLDFVASTFTYSFHAYVPDCTPPTVTTGDAFESTPISKTFLPYGMSNALDAAIMLGISDLDDVVTIIEAFRWMSWCFFCINVLRIPPASHSLRRLLDAAKSFKLADEKIIRFIAGMLSRAR